MRFSDSAYCVEWLRQFDPKDTLIAKSVIDSMWFVSAREVEVALWKKIESIITTESATKVAFYTVSYKQPGHFGSEHKIGYLLEHVRQFSNAICSTNPTENELLKGNYSQIVVVEDITASGGTLHDFLKALITPKIRSRISSGKLELHVCCFCAYKHGISHVLSASKSLKFKNFHTCVLLDTKRSYFTDTQVDFFKRSKNMTSHGIHPLGYKKTGCPVVFEYSCPNNTPAILHRDGFHYKALFSNKKVPMAVRELFNEVNRTPVFDLLTKLGVSNLV